jgi:4-amino-4-deoxy-L-arabinose transferase-like glycosyltransferase
VTGATERGEGATSATRGTSATTVLDRFALPALLLVAALARLPDLATRGTWDADQGHDMLVLRTLVRDGAIPLLGPPTSIGDVHHGAWYYYLLSPAAALTGGDSPLAVVALIALAGIAAVGVVWWLARSIGGPVAGLVAALLMALSTAAIDESTFIWNPNLIALSSAVALTAAWRAWSGGRPRWWLVAAVGTAVTMQCHVLGVALLPIVAIPLLLDMRRRSVGWIPLGIAAVFLVAYLPLILNEATSGFSETLAALDYLAGGRTPGETAIPVRFGIVGLRVVSWPLAGLLTDGFLIACLATVGVGAIAVWLPRTGGPERFVARWFGLGLLWSVVFLTVGAPSLASVVPGLPNDHYHAFADPLVFVLVGLGVGALARRWAATRDPAAAFSLALAGAAVVGLLGWNLTRLPPASHPDGGYPAGLIAGERVDAVLTTAGLDRTAIVEIRSIPEFKSTEALAYPLAVIGRPFAAMLADEEVAPGSADPSYDTSSGDDVALVLLCDDLFREVIGAPCGGPAENAVVGDAGGDVWGPLLDRFAAAPGRFVSVYGPPVGIANAGAP